MNETTCFHCGCVLEDGEVQIFREDVYCAGSAIPDTMYSVSAAACCFTRTMPIMKATMMILPTAIIATGIMKPCLAITINRSPPSMAPVFGISVWNCKWMVREKAIPMPDPCWNFRRRFCESVWKVISNARCSRSDACYISAEC